MQKNSNSTPPSEILLKLYEEYDQSKDQTKNIDYISQIHYLRKKIINNIKIKSNENISENKSTEHRIRKNNDVYDLDDFNFSNFENLNHFLSENAILDENPNKKKIEIENLSIQENEDYIVKLKKNCLSEDVKSLILNANYDNKTLIDNENDFKINENINDNHNKKEIISNKKNNDIKKIDMQTKNCINANSDKPKKIFLNNNYTSKIENQLEEELNNEIFNYTKNMKKYAKSFNEVLNKDNKTLNKIEITQLNGQKKTNLQLKNLNEFNYNLKIGFFKLIFMILFVFATFVMSLLMIRIFPKINI